MAKRFTCEICGKRFTSYTKNNTKSKFCGVCKLTLLAEEARAHGMDYGTYTALKYVKRMEEEQRQNQQEGQA